MTNHSEKVSRRGALTALSASLSAGVAGCSDLLGSDTTPTSTPTPTPTEDPTATPTPTPTPDRPNIERQTILRDKAAIPHIRWTVSGTIEWPEPASFDMIDSALLGRWESEGQALEFFDDLTFNDIRPDAEFSGTYFTIPQQQFLHIEYDDGEVFEYLYGLRTENGNTILDLQNSDGDHVGSFVRTVDGDDSRSVIEVAEHTVVYKPDDAQTQSQDLETGSAGSGFIVSPDGYIVTNAHVVGVHTDPEQRLYFRLAVRSRRELRQSFEEDFNLNESELQKLIDIFMEKLRDYYATNASIQTLSTTVGVLPGTATPDQQFQSKSWSASIETAGTVFETVEGDPTWGRDVAVLKVDEQQPLPTVRLGNSTDLGAGEEVFVIGYPDIGIEELFEDRETTLEPSLTTGVVSARRTLNSGVETIQTDAGINPGNSGGPMYDSDGEVVGIATFRPADVDLAEIAFALPIEVADGFLGELGVENAPGELTTTYWEGLNALWREDCDTVTQKMNAVQEMWPGHPYAQQIIDQC